MRNGRGQPATQRPVEIQIEFEIHGKYDTELASPAPFSPSILNSPASLHRSEVRSDQGDRAMISQNGTCIRNFRIASLAAALLLLTALASAQDSGINSPHVAPISGPKVSSYIPAGATLPALQSRPLRVDVNLVLVPVTVIDPMSRPVLDVPRQNFSLLEAGVPQEIRYFSHEDAPISVALVLDYSGSMDNKAEFVNQAVEQFFQYAHPDDDYYVITVSQRPALVADASQSTNTILARLASTVPHGMTALYDSIYLGVNKLRTSRYKRRAMVIVSDGGDNASRYNLKEVKSMLAESDVLTYSIGLFDDVPFIVKPFEERFGRKWLDEVTRVSGGRNIPADDRRDIPKIAGIISREIRSQYVLGYSPTDPNKDGKWRKISVKLLDNPDQMHVHFKEGYAAPGP